MKDFKITIDNGSLTLPQTQVVEISAWDMEDKIIRDYGDDVKVDKIVGVCVREIRHAGGKRFLEPTKRIGITDDGYTLEKGDNAIVTLEVRATDSEEYDIDFETKFGY